MNSIWQLGDHFKVKWKVCDPKDDYAPQVTKVLISPQDQLQIEPKFIHIILKTLETQCKILDSKKETKRYMK